MTRFTINGKAIEVDVEEDTPLLWVIRDEIGLTGTKFGCGVGMCGACTVHVGGRATRSCVTPVSAVNGAEITTIEGLSADMDGTGAAHANATAEFGEIGRASCRERC